jgi:hypothetical protein
MIYILDLIALCEIFFVTATHYLPVFTARAKEMQKNVLGFLKKTTFGLNYKLQQHRRKLSS